MKKLNLTEVKTIAKQIALDLYEMKKASFDKAVKNPKFEADLVKLAQSHPIVALYPTLAPHEQPVLLDTISYNVGEFKKSVNGKVSIPSLKNVTDITKYSIFYRGYSETMQRELNTILTKYKIPTEGTDLVREYNSGPVVNEDSKEFQSIRDKIIIAQIDCKDLQSLIKQVTKFFA